MAAEDIIVHQWSLGQSGNLKGRPKKWYSELVKTQGYSVSQINDVIQVMVSLTIDELKVIWQDEKSPVLEKIIAGALAKSVEKKSLYNLETLFSRVFGQPKQVINANIIVEQQLFPDVSPYNRLQQDNQPEQKD